MAHAAPQLGEDWREHVAASQSSVVVPQPIALEADTQALADLQRAVANVFAVHTRNAQRIRKEAQALEESRVALERDKARLLEEVEEAKETAMKEVEAERAHLADVWKDLTGALEKEKAAMQQNAGIQQAAGPVPKIGPKVRLDVGGHKCTTSKATLVAEAGSMLAQMFDGSTPLEAEEDGSYFIDRDGRHFHHVLNYLRDPPSFLPPASKEDAAELLKEAQYYQLTGLRNALLGAASAESLKKTVAAAIVPAPAMEAKEPEVANVRRKSLPRALDVTAHDLLFKLILLGDSRVGKSSLLKRFTSDEFTGAFKPTMGVEFGTQTVEVEGQLVKAQIWDIAGEERFRANPQATYRGAVGAVVVFDVGSAASLESLKARWLPELKRCGEPTLLPLMVGNKNDVAMREVSTAEGEAAAEQCGMSYMETSAQSGQGVTEAFNAILAEVYHYRRHMDAAD